MSVSIILLVYPYVFMEIGARMGQLPANEQCQVIHAVNFNHWKVQISISVSWLSKESQDSSMMGYPVIL